MAVARRTFIGDLIAAARKGSPSVHYEAESASDSAVADVAHGQESGMNEREFDVIVWGASGFTGRLVAEHLLAGYGIDGALRWALAGRNESRLAEVRRGLGAEAAALPLIIADADDAVSLDAVAQRTRVVCTTVGPYALYGSALVAACVARGTHYCDLTGEVPWMRRMIDSHHQHARETGARIVHTCGFDSIPSDLGVWFLQREMRRRHGTGGDRVKFRLRDARGGFSGGTIASMLNMLDEAERDPGVRAVLADPYGLNPDGERRGLDGPDRALPEYDTDFDAWAAPFVMGAINTRVVRRSNALLGHAYGRDFRYDEGMLLPFGMWGFPLAAMVSTGTAAAGAVASIGPLRRTLSRLLPQPGQGPSRQARESGYFRIELLGRTAAGDVLRVAVHGDRDPGYGATARMLGETAVCLAKDPLQTPGGVLTPAAAMGDALLERLPVHAGVTFDVVD
jgi:short subunit dehydrogenase-like uncharacterized protein